MAAKQARAKEAFSAMVKEKLSHGDKLILGKFLHHFARMHLDTGIKLGLACRLFPETNDDS